MTPMGDIDTEALRQMIRRELRAVIADVATVIYRHEMDALNRHPDVLNVCRELEEWKEEAE